MMMMMMMMCIIFYLHQVSKDDYEAELSARDGRTIEQATRTGTLGPFSGPPKFLLRAVSRGLFWYLQPRVREGKKGLCRHRPYIDHPSILPVLPYCRTGDHSLGDSVKRGPGSMAERE